MIPPTSEPIDLSHKLDVSKITIYPGDPTFSCTPFCTVEKDGYSVHSISLGSHTGTHLDAPSHWFQDRKTVDEIPLGMLIGKARVIDLTTKTKSDKITWDGDLQHHFSELQSSWSIVVLKTGWAKHWGTDEYISYPYIEKRAAEELVKRGVTVLGVDTLSPDAIEGPEGYGVHEVFLGAGNVLVENLNLTDLSDKDEELLVSFIPLNLAGNDGSPIRACAWRDDNVH
ncbi:hypothetical protein AAF712_000393 [Marasmius tenuissimus]|uniref:Cyclase n=1 Tax=Marasmius tenuissimus TaxID=585030 RepID=A0ABR3AFC9_9AGAR